MKMMNSLNIDTEKLEYEIEKMRQIEKTLEEVYEQIEKETTTLKDYWESKTADSVQESFIDFYKKVEKSKNNLASDIAFLENAVKYNAQYNKMLRFVIEAEITEDKEKKM